jgi:hypothetical protein
MTGGFPSPEGGKTARSCRAAPKESPFGAMADGGLWRGGKRSKIERGALSGGCWRERPGVADRYGQTVFF